MNIKNAVQNYADKEEDKQPEVITENDFKHEQTKTYIRHFDPRWDDLADDSRYWELILRTVNKKDLELASGLTFVRAIGAQIKKGKFKTKNPETGELEFKDMLVIRPVIDESGLIGWQAKEQYEEFRDKHLKPYFSIIRQMLDILGDPGRYKKVEELQNEKTESD